MKTKIEKIVTLLVVGVFTLVGMAAYASNRLDLTDIGTARVKVIHSEGQKVEISNVNVFQEGKDLIVAGNAIERGPLFRTHKGHIDVAVVSPDGKRVEHGTAEYRHIPSRHRKSDFSVRLPIFAGKGTEICMIFHSVNGTEKHPSAVTKLQDQCG